MKYIFINGGSFSGIGKGMLSSSIGVILQSHGYTVTFLKIDPYLNYNPGKLEPSEHGETYVLEDGTEADLDLGNYERMCNVILDYKNTLTSGKILYDIISSEKSGMYNGKTLRFCTDFYNYICERLRMISESDVCTVIDGKRVFKKPEFVIIELGGTIVDEESFFFIKSFSRFFSSINNNDKCLITIDYIIEIGDIIKTKLIQNSINTFRSSGLIPDVMVYRGSRMMDDVYKTKISNNCGIKENNIIWSRDCPNQYMIPQALFEEGLYESIKNRLCLEDRVQLYPIDKKFSFLTVEHERTKKIGIITRYLSNEKPYTSLEDALVCAGKHLKHNIEICHINYVKLANQDQETLDLLKEVDGIVIPGGFGDLNVDTKVMVANYARTNKIPCLGICLGFQIMVIEFARNVIGLTGASSEEFSSDASDLVIRKHPNIKCVNTGEDIFLGEYDVHFNSVFEKLVYKSSNSKQIFRHRYSLNPVYEDVLGKNGLLVGGKTDDNRSVAICVDNGSFYFGVQYHPELNSKPDSVNPIIHSFIKTITEK